MSLADYYYRAAVAASQVIAGFDADRFKGKLEQAHVGVAIGREAAGSTEGRALADLTIRLLARLYPALEIRSGTATDAEAESLVALARTINPNIEIRSSASLGIAIGRDASAFETTYFTGSHGWDALLSEEPVPTGQSQNPHGAGAAACLGVGEVFKRLFMPDWPERLTRKATFSTYLGEKSKTAEDVPNGDWALSKPGVLVGLGAIGNGAAWALARSRFIGSLHLVDHETIDLGNLQRYVLTTRADEGRSKTDIITGFFQGSLKAVANSKTWAEFVQEAGYDWPHALVALDSARDRRAVQASLPQWITNAWTQPGDLGVSVHGPFGGPGACLSCLYLPPGQVPNEDEIVANALGIPQLAGNVRTLLYTGAGVDRQLLEAVALGLKLPRELVLSFEGRPVRELYVNGVCGGALIPLGGTGMPRQEIHVPLSHQSALAGVLLSASLARRTIATNTDSSTITRIDVLRPLGNFLTQTALKAGTGLCVCEDRDYIDRYLVKYR